MSKNNYDGSLIYHEIQNDIKKHKLINYLSFRDGNIVLHERGEEIKKLAKIKEQK